MDASNIALTHGVNFIYICIRRINETKRIKQKNMNIEYGKWLHSSIKTVVKTKWWYKKILLLDPCCWTTMLYEKVTGQN